ncbi:MAG: hypothetical protein H0W39_02705 [Sphingomonas sp.]|nr:hypothetical protein [Sphingomonas sp.]
MTLLLPLLLLVQASQPEVNLKFRERAMSPTPVTDKDLRPVKPRDCRNDAEVQRTLAQLRVGGAGDCFIRDITMFSRR